MGRVYCGPYAEQVGPGHEGYAGFLLADGRVFIGRGAVTEGFIAFVACCACGWRGEVFDPSEDGEQEALEDWTHSHMLPLIVAAAQDGWQDWVVRVAYRAAEIATVVTGGCPERGAEVMAELAADVAAWQRVVEQLVEAAAMRGEW